jgi:hypothetical protein
MVAEEHEQAKGQTVEAYLEVKCHALELRSGHFIG